MELTNTNVRYLLTIYHLSQARLEVSSKDIAQTLDVSRASVTSMMSILTDKRLVTKERYGKVHLTDDGCRWARVLASQTDKLAETLQNRMELSYEEAWKAACAAVSELPRHCFEPIHVPDRQRMKWYQNPKVLCFAGGVAAALVGAKVAKSPKTRELCVAGMAKGMKLQQDARVTLQNMKEDAQDLCAEAKQKAAQETAEEA